MSCFTDIENKPDDWLVLDPLTIQKPIPKTGCDTNLIVQNYLSEFKTDAQKQKVKDNLGLYVDNIISSKSMNPVANKTIYQELNKLRGHVGLNQIEWVSDSNMNDFVIAGVYDINGQRTMDNDNLPILNTGSGHSFNARLEVFDSSIAPEGKLDDICITQKLTLSNRVAGDGDVYIRTGRGISKEAITWETWGKLQQNIEVGQVTSLDDFIDNGIYSGVCVSTDNKFTFVMVVINDYALAAKLNTDRVVNQFLYAVDVGGYTRYTTRKKIGYAPWSDEKIINEAESVSILKDKINNIPFATTEDGGLMSAEDKNKVDNAIDKNKCEFEQEEDSVSFIQYTGNGNKNYIALLNSADEKLAGVMSAEDKKKLDNIGKIIIWNSSSNMNDYKTAGIYDIYGERINSTDNLPINNTASGHSFRAQLFVLDSSLQPAKTEICVTQILMLSNRKGHEGKMYIRTYNQNNAVSDGWSNWAEFSSTTTLGSGGMVDAATLDSTTSWGEYNGVLFDMNWVHGGSIGQLNNLMASITNALTALSGGEIAAYMNELYYTSSSDDKGALKSNLFGAMFKLKVYHNDPVRNGLGAIIGNASLVETIKGYLKNRIVQELDIIPFTFLPQDYIAGYNQQPRVIRRYGDVDASGNVTWSKFYELNGNESIYQYQPTKFYGQ